MSAHLYLEGSKTGKNSKEEQIRCREGFRKLIEKGGFAADRRMPRLTACGGRDATFDDFKIAHTNCAAGHYVAMLVDSEDPVADVELTWDHLKNRDAWERPDGAEDEQVLFMTTCMETWMVTDRPTLREHYGHQLQENALPPPNNLEGRGHKDVYDRLCHATRSCANAYSKGGRSFELLGKLNPEALRFLPSFSRLLRILTARL